MNFNKNYYAKILLFGEHTILKGSQALAMPTNSFFGTWKYASNKAPIKKLQQDLPLLNDFLKKQNLEKLVDTSLFSYHLDKGLYFDSNIPTGYGLGSSGALCAAIYDVFGKENRLDSLSELKELLGKMESFFHGSSSGIDPLVCYLNYPLLIDQTIEKVTLPKENLKGKGALFLLDTQLKRETGPLVNEFLKRCEAESYDKRCESQLVPLVDEAIHSFINGDWAMLFSILHELSRFQFRYFDFMIPADFKEIWLSGLSNEYFKLKICGAGGGGFLLGMSPDFSLAQKALKDFNLKVIYAF